MVDEIQKGDTLFLHNREIDYLMGPFEAATDSTMNLVEHAWDGDFPFQVLVSWDDPVYGLSVDSVSDPDSTDNPISLPLRPKFQALSEDNTDKLLSVLKNHELSQQIISKR